MKIQRAGHAFYKQMDLRHQLAFTCAMVLAACSGSQSKKPKSEQCGVGGWSEVVDGLRGRLVASSDDGALRLSVELENVSPEALEIHWTGRNDVGFASFELEDENGAEVPEPEWRFGGNELCGVFRELLAPLSVVVHRVPITVFARQDDVRVVRIGAFWGRELPSVTARASIGARVSGSAPSEEDTLVAALSEDGTVSVRIATSSDPRGRPWLGVLQIPSVCIQ